MHAKLGCKIQFILIVHDYSTSVIALEKGVAKWKIVRDARTVLLSPDITSIMKFYYMDGNLETSIDQKNK